MSAITMSEDINTGDNDKTKEDCLGRPNAPCIEVSSPSIDTRFHVLADEHRRIVLTALEETTHGITSVQALASILSDRAGCSLTHEQAVVQLYHVILPKFADAGLVDYDAQRGAVRYVGHSWVEAVLKLAASWAEQSGR